MQEDGRVLKVGVKYSSGSHDNGHACSMSETK